MANRQLGRTHDVAKSDTPNDAFDWVIVGTAGSLVVEHVGGEVTTLAAVPANQWIPMSNGTNIKAASTAVGFMVV